MSDQVQERSVTRRRLDTFVGEWNVELIVPGDPPMKAQAQARFEWLDNDRFVLAYRLGTEGSAPGFPVAHCLIGADDTLGTYSVLYSDSRGIARLYHMSLKDGVWRQWRDDPTFYQRFSATFSKDGHTIKGAWENSEDGKNWKHDFDLIYARVGE